MAWSRRKIFFLGNKAGKPTYLLMVQDADGTIRTLLDPAALATSDTHASISYFAPSPDGAYVVVGVALAGSENATLHIIDTASGHLLPDAIDRTFGVVVSWHSPTSFFYTRLQRLSPHDPPSAYFQNQRVYLHTLGSDPEAEPLVYGPGAPSSPDAPINGFREVIETPGSPWLIARSTGGTLSPPHSCSNPSPMSPATHRGKPLSPHRPREHARRCLLQRARRHALHDRRQRRPER